MAVVTPLGKNEDYELSGAHQRLTAMENNQPELQWDFKDGWLLMAVYLAGNGRPAELSEIIGAADGTNHAIPTSQELSSAFTKLAQCEVLVRTGSKFAISKDHVTSVREALHQRGGLFKTPEKGLSWLRKSGLAANRESRIEVSNAELEAAFSQYRSSIRDAGSHRIRPARPKRVDD